MALRASRCISRLIDCTSRICDAFGGGESLAAGFASTVAEPAALGDELLELFEILQKRLQADGAAVFGLLGLLRGGDQGCGRFGYLGERLAELALGGGQLRLHHLKLADLHGESAVCGGGGSDWGLPAGKFGGGLADGVDGVLDFLTHDVAELHVEDGVLGVMLDEPRAFTHGRHGGDDVVHPVLDFGGGAGAGELELAGQFAQRCELLLQEAQRGDLLVAGEIQLLADAVLDLPGALGQTADFVDEGAEGLLALLGA